MTRQQIIKLLIVSFVSLAAACDLERHNRYLESANSLREGASYFREINDPRWKDYDIALQLVLAEDADVIPPTPYYACNKRRTDKYPNFITVNWVESGDDVQAVRVLAGEDMIFELPIELSPSQEELRFRVDWYCQIDLIVTPEDAERSHHEHDRIDLPNESLKQLLNAVNSHNAWVQLQRSDESWSRKVPIVDWTVDHPEP